MKKVKIERDENFEYTVTFKVSVEELGILRWVLNSDHFPVNNKEDNKEIDKLSEELETATKEFFTTGPGSL